MKMKLNEQKCLQKYFEAEVALGKRVTEADKQKLWNALKEIYGVSEERISELAKCADEPILREIDNDCRFKMEMRIQQFAKEYGFGNALDEMIFDCLEIKGKAIAALLEAGILPGEHQATEDVATRISAAARSGNVTAMFLFAIMNAEGVLLEQDAALAKRIVKKMALWTSADAQLFAMRCDPENAEKYYARLLALAEGSPDAELKATAQKKYGFGQVEADRGMKILRKAVERGFAKAGCYNATFARIAHSEVTPFDDKQRVLLSADEALVHAVSSLPLKLPKKPFKMSFAAFKTPFVRTSEEMMVKRVLSGNMAALNSVCFVANDPFVLKEYMRTVENCAAGGNVQRVDLDKIAPDELDGNLENIFLRKIKEGENNLFLISVGKDCPKEKLGIALDFIDCVKRARFKVKQLNVELNLSAVTAALFADSALRSELQDRATVIFLQDVSAEEKAAVIESYLKELCERYDLQEGLNIDGAKRRLSEMDMTEAVKALERTVVRAYIDGLSEISDEYLYNCYLEVCPGAGAFGFGRKN